MPRCRTTRRIARTPIAAFMVTVTVMGVLHSTVRQLHTVAALVTVTGPVPYAARPALDPGPLDVGPRTTFLPEGLGSLQHPPANAYSAAKRARFSSHSAVHCVQCVASVETNCPTRRPHLITQKAGCPCSPSALHRHTVTASS